MVQILTKRDQFNWNHLRIAKYLKRPSSTHSSGGHVPRFESTRETNLNALRSVEDWKGNVAKTIDINALDSRKIIGSYQGIV